MIETAGEKNKKVDHKFYASATVVVCNNVTANAAAVAYKRSLMFIRFKSESLIKCCTVVRLLLLMAVR